MWNIVIVDQYGSHTYKYRKTGSGAYSMQDAIDQAMHSVGTRGAHRLVNIVSVTATII